MKLHLFRFPRTAFLLTLLGISGYTGSSFATISKGADSANSKETLWLSQMQLMSQVPLDSPLQASATLNLDATVSQNGSTPQAIQQFQLSQDGVLEITSEQGNTVIGQIINPQLNHDQVITLEGATLRLGSGLEASIKLIGRGDPKEVSDTIAVLCTDSNGFPGTQDQINFITSREDVYEMSFSSSMGSIFIVRVVNQDPWKKLTECIRN